MTNPLSTLSAAKRDRLDRLAAVAAEEGGVSLLRDAIRRLRRNPVAITGAVIIALFLLLAIFAPWIAPKDPYLHYLEPQVRLGDAYIPGPQAGFPFGTDVEGRDLLSRLVYGSRQTLFVGVIATLIGLSIGVLIGSVAGSAGRWVDTVLMRVVDVMLSLPGLLLALTLVALTREPSQWTVIMAVAIANVPIFARLLRGSMLAQRESDHVLAATALGVRRRAVVLRHMLPNAMSPVIVQGTLTLATSIIDAAALSFLGLGDQDLNRPEWGIILGGQGQRYFDIRPELAFWPALAIILVALGFTLFGESLREALDPKNRR